MESKNPLMRFAAMIICVSVVVILLASCDVLDDGGMSAVEPPSELPTATTSGAMATITSDPRAEETRQTAGGPTSVLPGLPGWEESGSGDYRYFETHLDDGKNDAHVCVLDDISTHAMDLIQVGAVLQKAPSSDLPWSVALRISMLPPADATPDQFVQWAIEVQNNLGLLIFDNLLNDLDDSEFSQSAGASHWTMGSGEEGIDISLGQPFQTADEAVQAIAPLFENLTVTVKTETSEGQVCDEFPG
jgi:hypothetical protein